MLFIYNGQNHIYHATFYHRWADTYFMREILGSKKSYWFDGQFSSVKWTIYSNFLGFLA